MLDSVSKRATGLTGVLLALVTLAVYWPVTRNGFVNYDDDVYVTPLIGLFTVMAWGGYSLAAHWRLRHAVLGCLALVPILACIPVTRSQLGHWVDSVALFKHALRYTYNNHIAENNLGQALLQRGELEDARQHLVEAIRIQSDYAENGRFDEAVDMATRAEAMAKASDNKELAETNRRWAELFRSRRTVSQEAASAPLLKREDP